MHKETLNKKWRRGETNPETSLRFWQYEFKGTKQVWKTPEAYENKCERVRLKRKEYNDAHVAENSQKRGEWRKANPEKTKIADSKKYQKIKRDPERLKKHREYSRIGSFKWRKDNPEKAKVVSKNYELRNKIKRKAKNKLWNAQNKDKIRNLQRKFRKENPDYHNHYVRNRRKEDSLFDLTLRVRNRTSKAFTNQGFSKHSKTATTVGCSWGVLQSHIEQQFTDGMNWDNRTEWHIDHIVPLASAKTEQQLIELCHYTNLQPLWASDNLSKGCKIILDYPSEKIDTTPIV